MFDVIIPSSYQVAAVVFPRAEELKFRAYKRFEEMGKEVPAEAVNEMLGILKQNFLHHLSVSFSSDKRH